MGDNKPERPANCGECARYIPGVYDPDHGACDNWAGVPLAPTDVCHPNFGIKKKGTTK